MAFLQLCNPLGDLLEGDFTFYHWLKETGLDKCADMFKVRGAGLRKKPRNSFPAFLRKESSEERDCRHLVEIAPANHDEATLGLQTIEVDGKRIEAIDGDNHVEGFCGPLGRALGDRLGEYAQWCLGVINDFICPQGKDLLCVFSTGHSRDMGAEDFCVLQRIASYSASGTDDQDAFSLTDSGLVSYGLEGCH